MRAGDSVARLGGEEFALLLPETDLEGARTVCDSIREEIASHAFAQERGTIPVTVSIGIALFDGQMSASGLVDAADRQLARAKLAGRNRVVG